MLFDISFIDFNCLDKILNKLTQYHETQESYHCFRCNFDLLYTRV